MMKGHYECRPLINKPPPLNRDYSMDGALEGGGGY